LIFSKQECNTDTKYARQCCGKFNGSEDPIKRFDSESGHHLVGQFKGCNLGRLGDYLN